MNAQDRARFDVLLEDVLASLPRSLLRLLDESPLIVEDAPTAQLCRELDIDSGDLLCGLHSGIMMTERSIEQSGTLPTQIHIFRQGIVAQAGGWTPWQGEPEVREEIRKTVLHEIGRHFGLEEGYLDELGYS